MLRVSNRKEHTPCPLTGPLGAGGMGLTLQVNFFGFRVPNAGIADPTLEEHFVPIPPLLIFRGRYTERDIVTVLEIDAKVEPFDIYRRVKYPNQALTHVHNHFGAPQTSEGRAALRAGRASPYNRPPSRGPSPIPTSASSSNLNLNRPSSSRASPVPRHPGTFYAWPLTLANHN